MESFLERFDRQKKKRYEAAKSVLRNLTEILRDKYSAKKIVLIGSCLKEDHFHLRSDIDLCVEGLPNSLYFQALGELLIEAGEFSVDLIPIEDATERMMKYIKKEGEILYEE